MRDLDMPETGWSLHPQLCADTAFVCDLPLSRLLAKNDANFPWLILVPRRAGASELYDLGAEQAALTNEIALVSRALKDETRCDKLNVAAIGNVVPQLHIHIVARTRNDALWPKPVCGAAPPLPYDAGALDRGELVVRHRLPFSSLDLPAAEREQFYGDGPVEFSHSLAGQIGGQAAAGFRLTHLVEAPHHADPTAQYMPGYFATRAVKPAGG